MYELRFYRDASGETPARVWLDSIPRTAKVIGLRKLKLLKDFGNDLRRPHADHLRDGIFELRWKVRRVQYRLLYFFSGRQVIVVSHGITKTDRIPDHQIDIAAERRLEYNSKLK